jgi:FlaA1/EpsC-like NDP-sugar epimerase
VTAAPASRLASSPARDWRDRYAMGLVITDLLVLIWVIFGAQIGWFGVTTSDVSFSGSLSEVALSYTAISVVLAVSWLTILGALGSRSYRVLGTGPQEYKLVLDASVRLFGLVAIVAFLFKIELARGYILIAFPLGVLTLLLSRWIWRQWLGVQRLRGRYSSRVLIGIVGSAPGQRTGPPTDGRLPGGGRVCAGQNGARPSR